MHQRFFALPTLAGLVMLCASLTGPAAPALAEGAITYTADGGEMGQLEMTERWRGGALRTDIAGVEAYMLMRDGETYSITSAGGQIMVFALSGLAEVAEGQAAGPSDPREDAMVIPEEILDITPTGDTREVAGVSGEIHEVAWLDEDGVRHTDTAVLSDDPRLLENQDLKIEMSNLVSGQEPNPLSQALQDRGLAALSFGDRYEVLSIEDSAGPERDFELPAEPMDLGDMTGGMSQ